MCDHTRPTTTFTLTAAALATALLTVAGPAGASAQVDPPPGPPAGTGSLVVVVPGERYEAGSLRRFFFGDNWRDLWVRELTVPVLDLDRFGGGLTVDQAGGNQTRTLHFFGGDGNEYMFRSIQKWTRPTLPPDLQGTMVEEGIQDYISAHHPGGAFVVAPLQRTLGLLTEPLTIRVMPDDARLGEFREAYAGLVGQMLRKSNEGEDDTPGTFGSTKIVGSDALLERLEETPRNRVDERELLAARLLDFLVGDTDRGLVDQWRWARFPAEDGFLWRPIARDRDWAFMNAEGLVGRIARRSYDKVTDYGPRHSSLNSYVWQEQGLSRRLLTGLGKAEWDAVVARVQAALTDEVIRAAVDSLPPELEAGHADWLAMTLRERRDDLDEVAAEYYAWLATDVDIRATDQDDRLEALRDPDGSLLVTLYAPASELVAVAEDGDDDEDAEDAANDDRDGQNAQSVQNGQNDDDGAAAVAGARAGSAGSAWRPYYTRRFLPGETDEVRVYLHGGDDVALVRGEGARGITLRVIGGGGDDELVDTGTPSSRTAFYDDRGENRIVPGRRTHVSTEEWAAPEEGVGLGFVQTKTQAARVQDWGDHTSLAKPAVDYGEGAGLIIGAGPQWTDYGFRHHPYEARLSGRLLFGTRTASFGVEGEADFRRENSPLHLVVNARATTFEAIRFYGYGNASPAASSAESLVLMDQARLGAALAWDGAWWDAAVGPLFLYTDPEPAERDLPALRGGADFAQAGGLARASFDRAVGAVPDRGWELDLETAAFPGLLDAEDPFGRSGVEGRAYFGLPFLSGPVLAFRAGARHAWGPFPVHDAAMIGGNATLRGYRWQRFAGDAAVYGGAELRVPLFRAELLTKGRLGVLGLTDAGRVYVDGDSPGGWHTSHGAGLWFETLGQALTFTWARGEEDRFYVGLGMPF